MKTYITSSGKQLPTGLATSAAEQSQLATEAGSSPANFHDAN